MIVTTSRRCPECPNPILYSFGLNLYFCEDHGPQEPSPQGVCVERDGKCILGDDCRCKALEPKEGEVW